MQLIILSAFAIVLWLDPSYHPYLLLSSGQTTLWLVVIHPLAVWVAAYLVARAACAKLRSEPQHPGRGQRILARGTVLTNSLVFGGLLALIFLTDWVPQMRGAWFLGRVYGLDELCVLAPFLAGLVLMWIGLYPADRDIRKLTMEARLWESLPTHPVWSRREYVIFHVRHHLLIIMIPMVLILITYDATRAYDAWLHAKTKIFWAADGVLGIVAGIIFFFLPVMLVYVWSTKTLGPGRLRDRLQEMCDRIGLRYRRILVWNSGGQVTNAAVTGLLAPVRYIMLSDGLLETMEEEEIEAVFGHEAGHVKHHHILYFLFFAILSMCLAGGAALLAVRLRWVDALDVQMQQSIILVALAVIWAFGFGWVSRRFERQADLYGARSLMPRLAEGGVERHEDGTSGDIEGDPPDSFTAAAECFARALLQIADLNGIPPEARSWRHSSIASRVEQLRRFARDREAMARFDRKLLIIKAVLFVATAVACTAAANVYWPW
jgi:STE24 endopeptidase